MSRTYLDACLKEDILCRWPDGAMPLNVYIAPFVWYEKKKQQQSLAYRQMVLDALDTWRAQSNGLISFNVVGQLNQSQIDFKWRRIDRKTLGHCTYEIDAYHRIYSAEVQIGISDGLLHARYEGTDEVRHTILHEIGHALGLIGHSDDARDIMYVPHQFGIYNLSPRDAESLQWLYKLPVGFYYRSVATKYKLEGAFTINDVIEKIDHRIKGLPETKTAPLVSPVAMKAPQKPHISLEEHHEILSEMGRFYLKTQNIQVNKAQQDALRLKMMEKKIQERIRPPEV